MTRSVIVAGARTPIGKFRGSLAGFDATDLGAIAIRAALERSGVAADQVEYVLMGHVIQAGTGQITARQAAVGAGDPGACSGDHGEQGLSLRALCDRDGRPDDPGG